ncbi:MAG: NAD(P)H-dependent flavin oxidoreductase [Beijerinckiaceae bacterium]
MFLDHLRIPIIQGPMLGASGEAMVVAVSNAGGLGSLAAAGLSPDVIRKSAASIRAATDRPFLINIFILKPADPDSADVAAAMERLAPWRERLGLPPQSIPNQWAEPFEPQFAALLDAAPPAVSFTFGILTSGQIAALKSRGSWVIGTATTAAEARAWAEAGADAICAQGFEAGGHRGTFLKDVSESQVGTLSLVSTIREAVALPVIAAGGITDGKAVAAALAMGAAAVQVGTAYLLADESMISAPWRKAIAEVGDDATRLTRAFSGRHARGIENRFMREMRAVEHEIPAYPIQNALTQELRAAAAKAGSAEELSLWAGQSVKLAAPGPAAEITARLWREAQEALRTTSARWLPEKPAAS